MKYGRLTASNRVQLASFIEADYKRITKFFGNEFK